MTHDVPTDRDAGRFTLAAVGQSLIIHDVRKLAPPGFGTLVDRLAAADLAFTNYETSLAGDGSDGPANPHPSDPVTLDALRWMGFDLLSLANNHAFEGGTSGVIATREYAESLGFVPAGTGADLATAAAPGFATVGGRLVAFLAFDTANLQTRHAVAGPEGPPGVNPIRGRRVGDGIELDDGDVERALASIAAAAAVADHVVVSLHEHLWPKEWKDVAFEPQWHESWRLPMEWKRDLTHEMVDAGASVFLGHGFPRASAVEMYRGAPIFYSLGNFIFQTDPAIEAANVGMWQMPDVWHGYLAEVVLSDDGVEDVRLVPVVIVDSEGAEGGPIVRRTHPVIAGPDRASAILSGVVEDSAALGTVFDFDGGEAVYHAG
jgi:poly-gamma-glutamate capsule biosynthesis protein CapA/YwtB (metallophosphatase superfamily)